MQGHIVKLEMASNFTRILSNENMSPNSKFSQEECTASFNLLPSLRQKVHVTPMNAETGDSL
jgi:hypothetical protein